jgi:hypothetical protein
MYKKYYHKDVILSNVLISFACALLLGVVFYAQYIETSVFTPDLYLFLSLTSLMGIVFLYTLVRYFLSINHPVLDYEIDFTNEVINLSKRRKVHFKDIKLYARKKERSEIKIFFGIRTMNIIETHLLNESEEVMTEEQIMSIGKYAITVSHRKLYNYNLIFGLFISFANLLFVFFGKDIRISSLDINMIIITSIALGLFIILALLNQFRLKHLYDKLLQDQGTTEES